MIDIIVLNVEATVKGLMTVLKVYSMLNLGLGIESNTNT